MLHKCICVMCDKEFRSLYWGKFCSDDCRRASIRKKMGLFERSLENCATCHKSFVKKYRHHIFCSQVCRNKHYLGNRDHPALEVLGSTATMGAIQELRVAVDLMSRGWAVFRALSPSSPFDLAIYKDKKMLRLEVRTGYRAVRGGLTIPKSWRDDLGEKFDLVAVTLGTTIEYWPITP